MDIRLHHLSIGYRRGPVVARDINITILGGRLTCLIGDNGIGKSTLLRTLSGFQPKVGGEIWLGSREADSLSQRERSRIISIVLTQRPEMGGLTVHDLVGMGRSPYTGFWGNLAARDELAVRQSLVETGAWPLRDRKIDFSTSRRPSSTSIVASTRSGCSRAWPTPWARLSSFPPTTSSWLPSWLTSFFFFLPTAFVLSIPLRSARISVSGSKIRWRASSPW